MKLAKHNKRALVLTGVLYVFVAVFFAIFIALGQSALGGNSDPFFQIILEHFEPPLISFLFYPLFSFFCKKNSKKTTVILSIILGIPIVFLVYIILDHNFFTPRPVIY